MIEERVVKPRGSWAADAADLMSGGRGESCQPTTRARRRGIKTAISNEGNPPVRTAVGCLHSPVVKGHFPNARLLGLPRTGHPLPTGREVHSVIGAAVRDFDAADRSADRDARDSGRPGFRPDRAQSRQIGSTFPLPPQAPHRLRRCTRVRRTRSSSRTPCRLPNTPGMPSRRRRPRW